MSKPVKLGNFHHVVIDSDVGDLKVVAYYQNYPAIPGNETDIPELAYVEINAVYLTDGDEFFLINPSKEWIKLIEDEILDSIS
ncbi:MAG: hypothetical protein L3J21_09785 [Devosiaceae bacterium]|nr:hypothetical protein [Devosiaceae bacterium]